MTNHSKTLGLIFEAARHQRIRLSQSIIRGITAVVDAIILAGLGLIIFWVYLAGDELARLSDYLGLIVAQSLIVVLAFAAAGLYRFGRIIHPTRHGGTMISILIGMFLLLVTFVFALKISEQFSRVWIFSWLAASVVLIPAGRFAIANLVGRLAVRGDLGRNIAIYGAGTQGADLIKYIDGLKEPWNRIIGVFDDRKTRNETEDVGYQVNGTLDELVQTSRKHRVDEILIALPWGAAGRLAAITHTLSTLPTNIRLSPEFVGTDFLHRGTTLQYGIPMISIQHKPVTGWLALVKLTMDYLFGGLMLLLALPLITGIAIWIKLDSKGPVFFRQTRYGFNQKRIQVFKFRTMYVEDTDANAEQLTLKNDPRVTKAGALLRRFSLDELPQLFNVMLGEMSVVGPRPHALKAKAGGVLYDEVLDEYASRYRVKPGITGWAQVNGWRGNTDTEEDLLGRVEHDLYYIENWSILFDMQIVVRTFMVVLRGENAY